MMQGRLDNLVMALGNADEAAELRYLRQRAARADQLENQIAALNAQVDEKADQISPLAAFALGVIAGKAGAEQQHATGFTMLQDAHQAGRATLRRHGGPQRPVQAVAAPQPA